MAQESQDNDNVMRMCLVQIGGESVRVVFSQDDYDRFHEDAEKLGMSVDDLIGVRCRFVASRNELDWSLDHIQPLLDAVRGGYLHPDDHDPAQRMVQVLIERIIDCEGAYLDLLKKDNRPAF